MLENSFFHRRLLRLFGNGSDNTALVVLENPPFICCSSCRCRRPLRALLLSCLLLYRWKPTAYLSFVVVVPQETPPCGQLSCFSCRRILRALYFALFRRLLGLVSFVGPTDRLPWSLHWWIPTVCFLLLLCRCRRLLRALLLFRFFAVTPLLVHSGDPSIQLFAASSAEDLIVPETPPCTRSWIIEEPTGWLS
jgi:hypothetical protein